MKLTVSRYLFTNESTIGQLSIDGNYQCFTLEPPVTPNKNNGNGYICISEGSYPLTIQWSFKFCKQVPHVQSVPGRSFIEIHTGNFASDTDGCTLVGTTQPQANFIGQSAVAWTILMSKLYPVAILTNPDASEIEQVWTVGEIKYFKQTV